MIRRVINHRLSVIRIHPTVALEMSCILFIRLAQFVGISSETSPVCGIGPVCGISPVCGTGPVCEYYIFSRPRIHENLHQDYWSLRPTVLRLCNVTQCHNEAITSSLHGVIKMPLKDNTCGP